MERFSGCAPAIRKRPFGGELLEYFSTVFKGALVGCVATELTKYQIVVVRMDHLIILMIGLVVGFASGYGIRSGISHHRHTIAKRNRTLIG